MRSGDLRGSREEELFRLVDVETGDGSAVVAQGGEAESVLGDIAGFPCDFQFCVEFAQLKCDDVTSAMRAVTMRGGRLRSSAAAVPKCRVPN